jgi:hypothetical protein
LQMQQWENEALMTEHSIDQLNIHKLWMS